VRGDKPGDVVAIDLIELTPFGAGQERDPARFRDIAPRLRGAGGALLAGARRRAWFGGRIPLPLNPNLGTISTIPPGGYKPSYAGAFAKAGLPPADTAAGPISRPQIDREAGGNNAVLANVAIDLNNRPESASLAEPTSH
jgi:hypothetical protein